MSEFPAIRLSSSISYVFYLFITGGWLVQRKITNWKCSRKSIISFDKENVTNKHFKVSAASIFLALGKNISTDFVNFYPKNDTTKILPNNNYNNSSFLELLKTEQFFRLNSTSTINITRHLLFLN